MQSIADVIAKKEQQYGKTFIPKNDQPASDYDELWEKAMDVVDSLTDNAYQALEKGIDKAISDKAISESELESRGAISSKIINNISDLKYWGWLKQGMSGSLNRTSLVLTKKIHGFECELVIYESADKFVAWYALFNNQKNKVYRRDIGNKAPF